MSLITILLLAIALAMDAFAVSVSSGVANCRMHFKHAFIMAAFFGVFQAIMPIAGWSAGRLAANLIVSFDHWIAFSLLAIIGGKMLYESFSDNEDKKPIDITNIYILLTLAFATSIDAAAVGISMSFLKVNIIIPSIIIGIITFLISLCGVHIGCRFGNRFGSKAEILGGIVLIGIGIKILVEHLFC